jgi:tetratricopeptide (TPR) repeat protein
MPSYLWSAKNPAKKEIVERVTAATVSDAREQLLNRGFTDLVLKTDEVYELSASQVESDFEEPDLSPAEALQMRDSKWAPLIHSIKQSKGTILFGCGALGWGLYSQSTFFAFGGLAAILLLPLFHCWFGLSTHYYTKLNEAKVAHQWELVLHLVERLKLAGKLTKIGVGEIELTRCRSQALAALGQLDVAVAEFSRFEHDSRLPHWLFLAHLTGIYDSGKAYDKATEVCIQAAREQPDNNSLWIDLAFHLARYRQDTVGARSILAKLKTEELVDFAQPWLPLIRGFIAVAEKDFPGAQTQFEQALTGFQALNHLQLMPGLILLTKAYLCWTNGALGNFQPAEKLFRETEAWLVSAKEDELLSNCRHALGRD